MQLRAVRKEKGMTIYSLAAAVNVTPATICRYEKGVRTPSVPIAKRIGKVLDIPWPEIVDNRESRTEQPQDDAINAQDVV